MYRKPPFPRKTSSPAVPFVSFLQEKKTFSFLFFLEEKTVSSRGKRSPSDGRTQAHPALSSVGIPHGYASLLRLVSARVRRACAPAFPCKPTSQKKIICGKAIILHCCLFRQRAMQNGRFVCEPSVFRFKQDERESCSSQTNDLPRNVFCFFSSRKEIVPLYLGKKEIVPLKKEKIVPPGLRRKAARASARRRPAWRRPPSRGHGASEYGSAQETQRPSAASRPHRRAAPPRRGIRAPPQAAGT